MLRQLCKNDAYLYEQIMALWDETDPKSKKRFYPPYYMDVGKSFGIESYVLKESVDLEYFKYFDTVYRFNTVDVYNFIFDYNARYDKISPVYKNGNLNHIDIQADSLLDIENNYNEQSLEIVTDVDSNGNPIHTLRPPSQIGTYEEILHHDAVYTTVKNPTNTTKGKYVNKKVEKLGKAKKDAYFYGAFKNWHCNNHWYNGYNRNKNYSVKQGWKKDPYGEDKDIVKKYGVIPSVCHAQTFKAQNTGRVSKVSLNIQGSKSAVSPCVVEIRTTENGKPTTKVLARTERKFSGTGDNIVAFEFKTKAKIEKGKTYAIVIRSPLSKFQNTYRIGGWTTGCFSSESKYYKDGSAYTSQDNGKTWVKNGKTSDTKSYGAHYYDWGINQKPIDFAFEVYVQPISYKTIKEYVKTTTKTYKPKKVLSKEAYDEVEHTYEYNYFKEGSYYLHLKPIQVSPMQTVVITDDFNTTPVTHDSPYWAWEYYNPRRSRWEEVSDNRIRFDNNVTNYTVLKLRIRCDVTQSTFGGQMSRDGIANTVDETILQTLLNAGKIAETHLDYLQHTLIEIYCRRPTKAYLRTQYYHPPQDQMLGASIWSEVDVSVDLKDAEVEIDIIHEREAIEHFQFYDLSVLVGKTVIDGNNQETIVYHEKAEEVYLELSQYIQDYNATAQIDEYEDIIEYILENTGFVEYLKKLTIPVYILPFTHLVEDVETTTYFFESIQLSHLPSYPLIGGDVGEDDIIIDTVRRIHGKSEFGGYFYSPVPIDKTLNAIYVTYTINTDMDTVTLDGEEYALDEDGFEINDSEVQETIKETLKGIILNTNNILNDNGVIKDGLFTDRNNELDTSIDYAMTNNGKYIVFNFQSEKIQLLFPNLPNTTLANSIGGEHLENLQLRIDLVSKAYQEFVDFEVDYDTGEMLFYNQQNLMMGDFKISYNPLWVRGLSVADFPLKMDLWIEKYRVGKDKDGLDGVYKRIFNTNSGEYEDGKFYPITDINPMTNEKDLGNNKFYTFRTTVAPLDSIRKLVHNEESDGGGVVLEEDSEYFVDYSSNTVTIAKNMWNFAEGDILTIHYTPNLVDNGLALAYRLKRNRYNGDSMVSDDNLNYEPNYSHDAYIGMNSFTYRT
ncbi:MAG: hypothetical protein J6Y78_11080 [Paludibacteraceae bacterium]|nr:hypothetical protein [Paludibacteraceae bacterium]